MVTPVVDLLQYISNTSILAIIIGLLVGASIGSFINVVIHRLPLMMYKEWSEQCKDLQSDPILDKLPSEELSLAKPASHCPQCNSNIPAYHNIPILSFLVLRGKCSACGHSYTARYFYVELLCCLLGGYLLYQYGISIYSMFLLLFTFFLVPLIFIDLDHKLLPDNITYLLLWCGVIASIFGYGPSLNDSVVGVITGYLSLWSVYMIFKVITGKEGMGHGDFKLLAAIGAWVGWQQLLSVILLSSLSGTIIGIFLLIKAKRDEKPMSSIPFGPFLAIGGWITLFWGAQLTQLYFSMF